MICAIYVALGVAAFLMILNGFLMRAKKTQIDVLLGVLLVGLVIAAFAIAGWKSGILAIGIAFLSAVFTRSIAARTASRLLALSARKTSGYIGLPSRRLQTISQQLGQPFNPNQPAEEMFAGGNRSADPLTALLDYCESQAVIKKVMNELQVSRDDLRELYYDLLRSGAGQWVGGHYVAASALAYPEPLRYLLVKKRNSGSFNIEMAFNVIMYFEQGLALEV